MVLPLKKAFLALYCAFAARYLTSFFSLPFLAHTLGPTGLGDLAIAMSIAAMVSILVEYGFSVSALREVSSAEPIDRGRILVSVTTAKLALASIVGIFFAISWFYLPDISRFPANLPLVILLGGAQAFHLDWYFLGIGRATVSAVIEALTSLTWFIPVFFFVHSESDVNVVITCQLVAQIILVAIAYGIAAINLTNFSIDWSRVFGQIKSGGPLFIMKAASAAHTAAIVLILGAACGPVQVGYLNAADRFAGTIIVGFYPAAQALMPYVFGRVARDGRDSIFSVSRNILIVLLLVSVILTLIIYLSANLLILTFTGTHFAPSIQVLQILSFTFPFIAINQALGLYTMLPLRLDISFVASVLLGECVSLVLTYLVAPSFGAVGAASCRVLEAGITALAIALVLYNKKYMQKLLLPKVNSSEGLVLPPIPLQ